MVGLGVASLVAAAAVGAVALSRAPASVGASAAPRFVEEALAGGIDHVYDGDWEFFVGGGAAAFDCNDDGRPDLYLAGGSGAAALYRNDSPVGGQLGFTRLPDPVTDLTAVTGAYPLDVDGDGLIDLAVLRLGENVLLRGLGDCRFERANEAWRVDGGSAWTTGFSAAWESSSGLPTLAFGNYLELDANESWTGSCSANTLFRPRPEGEAYDPPLDLEPGWCTLSILFSDWSGTGSRDLRVSNDRHYYGDSSGGEEQLWRIPAGTAPTLYTSEDGWQTLRIWGMGIASYDLTGDGRPEVFLTSQGDNKLQTLVDGSGQPRYGNIALERGVTAHRPFAGGDPLPSTAWHAEFQDVNNDGFIDLFVAKGNVESMPEYAAKDPNNLLLGQPDGTFVEGAEDAGILTFARARGGALVDFNLDGLLDLVVVNRREQVMLWRNTGSGTADEPRPMGRWVAVRIEQPAPNVDAIGAWIEVRAGGRTVEREVTVGGGHAGGQLGWVHVGLGENERAEIRVTWPDGEESPWLAVDAGGFVIVERGATEARPWNPPTERDGGG